MLFLTEKSGAQPHLRIRQKRSRRGNNPGDGRERDSIAWCSKLQLHRAGGKTARSPTLPVFFLKPLRFEFLFSSRATAVPLAAISPALMVRRKTPSSNSEPRAKF